MSNQIICCYTNFLIGSAKCIQFLLKNKIISLVRMFQQLRNASVLTRARCFLPWVSKLKIQESSKKTSEC